ncbi:MAG: hypothetical protein K2R98_28360 [Gemmataceae bacterium]|nr:hypothetical protein [Gemmataceae bacterium]
MDLRDIHNRGANDHPHEIPADILAMSDAGLATEYDRAGREIMRLKAEVNRAIRHRDYCWRAIQKRKQHKEPS